MLTIWGVTNGQASALPMAKLRPTNPASEGYTLYWNIDEQALDYAPMAFDPTTGDATTGGNFGLALGKVYKINSLQVVGARVTGWVAASGTATRTTFDTATVTTEQLAQRFKALLDDMMTHGLLGT